MVAVHYISKLIKRIDKNSDINMGGYYYEKEIAPEIIRMVVIRLLLGLSQSELASLIGYSKSYVAKIECGDRTLTANYLLAFCRALKVSPDYILFAEIKPFINF